MNVDITVSRDRDGRGFVLVVMDGKRYRFPHADAVALAVNILRAAGIAALDGPTLRQLADAASAPSIIRPGN